MAHVRTIRRIDARSRGRGSSAIRRGASLEIILPGGATDAHKGILRTGGRSFANHHPGFDPGGVRANARDPSADLAVATERCARKVTAVGRSVEITTRSAHRICSAH